MSSYSKEEIGELLRTARDEAIEKGKKAELLQSARSDSQFMKKPKKDVLKKAKKRLKEKKKRKKSTKQKNKQKTAKSKMKKSRKRKVDQSSSSSDSSSNSSTISSSSNSDTDSSTSASDTQSSCSSSGDEHGQRKLKKLRKKKRRRTSYSSAESDYSGRDKQSTATGNCKPEEVMAKGEKGPLQREDWMTNSSLMLRTYSKDKVERKPAAAPGYQPYDPTKNARELNPYWKSTGTGLPAFRKPDSDDSDNEEHNKRRNGRSFAASSSTSTARNWMKKPVPGSVERREEEEIEAAFSDCEEEATEPSYSKAAQTRGRTPETTEDKNLLSDQEMNALSAKILKAEIIGNFAVANELKKVLESARKQRCNVKAERNNNHQRHSEARCRNSNSKTASREPEHVLLTHTDQQGHSRPLASRTAGIDPRELYGGRRGQRKQKTRPAETHLDGERVRYFPDDDRYDIKQMFEREKYSSAADANLEFANIASKHKNPNDDLDDIFADRVRRNVSTEDADRRDMQKAIHEHQKLSAQLENCDKCFESSKMDKQLMVAMGVKVYLALPWHTGLQAGHCIITPMQHVSCSTQLDEDSWAEINEFRKALTKMFAKQRKDVIFFEIANNLHRRPHLSIHCIPIPESKGEMAPFYFKKAIEESEYEWCINKQLIPLAKKSLRNSVPNGLPYFWVNFGMDSGFAHVIEDQERFPSNFAFEIIGGILHLDANIWRKTKKEQNIAAKIKQFAEWWKPFDSITSS